MNKVHKLGLVLFLFLGFLPNGEVVADEAKKLHQLFDTEWNARLARDPISASQANVFDYNAELPDVSAESYKEWAVTTKRFLKQLDSIDFKKLNDTDKVNYKIFKAQLERRLSNIEFRTYEMPFLADSGFHTRFNRINQLVRLKSEQDYLDYLSRLEKIPSFFAQNIENMKKGLARGYSMPKVVMNGFSDTIAAVYSVPLEESAFYQPFKSLPKSIDKKTQQSLQKQAKSVISDKVYRAYKTLKRFFDNEYIPQTRTSLAAYKLPNGKNFYQAQIEHYTTLDMTADEVHTLGLAEVKRIREEMMEVIKASGHKGDFASFLKFLRESPQFYAKTPLELIKEASYISKKMDGKLPKLFNKLPRQPYTVEPVPEAIAPKYTTGRYSGAPIDSDRPGEYWVNTYALDKRPLYVLEALTLHEAVPGHHLQSALNKELEGIPEFRRRSYISAFGEGWGLYSERLGLEVGFYQDHYSNFGRLTYEMWRAARLVIDTGIHSKGWSREQAIALLEENSALSSHNIRTEVDRYISWPGQALSYKIGEIKIRKLRKMAEEKLGGLFDIRGFHDTVLSQGSVPLNVLEEQVKDYVKTTLLPKH